MLHRGSATSTLSAPAAVRWRAERLARAGLPRESAWRIAADPSYDLHAFLELVDRGCPPDLALRILAPLDERPGE
jgi:hypothetical protein